ncbi:MAG TPA: LysR family transcriptional regulator [Planctomycetota bacterium]|jgi:molybdate transport repressor ModE-like protein|nr:LysR family transcriptional regulator [Planctomycetota bacterium]
MSTIKILDRDLPLRLEWLRSFLVVAETGGFSRAARELHLSQPAVWTHVRELEENLGTRLLEPVGGRARLTRAGETAAREARRLLEGVRAFREAVAEAETTVQGVLALGASTTPGNYLLPPVMQEFERRYPKARATLSIGNSAKIFDRLRSNEVDLGVVGIEPEGTEFAVVPLCEDELVLFASRRHPLARRREVSAEDWTRERLVVREPDSATRRLTDRLLARREARPPLMELGCPETVKRAVAAGLGIGVLSRFAIAGEVRHGELVELRAPGFPIRRKIYAAYPRRKHLTRLMTSFLELLEKAASRR